jgi:hypothetical protein
VQAGTLSTPCWRDPSPAKSPPLIANSPLLCNWGPTLCQQGLVNLCPGNPQPGFYSSQSSVTSLKMCPAGTPLLSASWLHIVLCICDVPPLGTTERRVHRVPLHHSLLYQNLRFSKKKKNPLKKKQQGHIL